MKPSTYNGTENVLQTLERGTIETLDDIIDWMRSKTVPLALTPNDTNVTGYVNLAYAEYTHRSQAEWLGDIHNPKRFAEGEILKVIESFKTAKGGIITDLRITCDMWNLPGVPFHWYADALEIKIGGRSYRLLHSKYREQARIMI